MARYNYETPTPDPYPDAVRVAGWPQVAVSILGWQTEPDADTEWTGMGVTKDASSIHVNLIYSPQPKLDFGIELLLADREIESGADGDLTRLQFSAKYAY